MTYYQRVNVSHIHGSTGRNLNKRPLLRDDRTPTDTFKNFLKEDLRPVNTF